MSKVRQFRPQELANILWAFATLAIRHGPLFEAAAEAMVNTLDALNAYDLGQFFIMSLQPIGH